VVEPTTVVSGDKYASTEVAGLDCTVDRSVMVSNQAGLVIAVSNILVVSTVESGIPLTGMVIDMIISYVLSGCKVGMVLIMLSSPLIILSPLISCQIESKIPA